LPVQSGAGGSDYAIVEELAQQNLMTPRMSGSVMSYDTKATYEAPNGASLRVDLERGMVPVVAIYGPGKPLLRNSAHVDIHRKACLDYLDGESVGRVLAVRIRPVPEADDPVVHRLIRKLGSGAGERAYVGPGHQDCEAFQALGFSTKRMGLGQYLDAARSV